MPLKKPIVISNWQRGISTAAPFEGISDMRNIDNSSNPLAIKLAFRLQQLSPTAAAGTFTADASSDVITSSADFTWNGHNATSRAVTFTTTVTLPAPLVAGTIYYLIGVTSTTYKVATTLDNAQAGTAIDITNTGTGVHTITSVNMRTPKAYAYDARAGNVYLLDSLGQVWEGTVTSDFYLITGNTLTSASGNAIAVWKNYLFVFRNQSIDVWGSLLSARSARTWSNAWKSCNQGTGDSSTHTTQVMSNDILYFADRNNTTGTPYVGSLAEVAGSTFDPASSSTYTFNNQALDLPKYKYITDLQEYGSLRISTIAVEIYSWDTFGDSFDDPIISPEVGVTQMSVVNNLLYFAVNKTGNIYVTQGTSNIQPILDLPVYLTNTDITNVTVNYMIPYNMGLLFTVTADDTTTSPINSVWYYDLFLKSLSVKNEYSTGSYSTTTPGALFTIGGTPYLAGWGISTTSFGVDTNNYSNTQQRVTGYLGYVESALFQIGTSLYPTNLSRIAFNLAKPLAVGQGVKLEQRQTLSDSYTTIGTYDYTTYGAIQTIDDFPNVQDAQSVQIRASLTVASGAVGVSANDSPELMNITLQW